VKVLVAADRPVIRDFVEARIREGMAAEVKVSSDARSCREMVASWGPEIALLDLGLPEREVRRLCSDLSATHVQPIVMVAEADEALRMLEAGAVGVSSASDGVHGLLRTLDTVAGGHTHVPSALLGGLLHGLIERQRDEQDAVRAVDRLSAREREVLMLLGEGCDQRDIARRLEISPQTAKTHIRHLLHKLGVRSRAEAAALAAELGPSEGVNHE
jgi:DNA-binding NarL/FixJ family response regulator